MGCIQGVIDDANEPLLGQLGLTSAPVALRNAIEKNKPQDAASALARLKGAELQAPLHFPLDRDGSLNQCEGLSPLAFSCSIWSHNGPNIQNTRCSITKLLVDGGADVNFVVMTPGVFRYGYSVLSCVIEKGCLHCARHLFSGHQPVNVHVGCLDKGLMTPYEAAFYYLHAETNDYCQNAYRGILQLIEQAGGSAPEDRKTQLLELAQNRHAEVLADHRAFNAYQAEQERRKRILVIER